MCTADERSICTHTQTHTHTHTHTHQVFMVSHVVVLVACVLYLLFSGPGPGASAARIMLAMIGKFGVSRHTQRVWKVSALVYLPVSKMSVP